MITCLKFRFMLHRSTWLHLRFPFSIFLLPIYLLALSISETVITVNALLALIILHLFLYPASNGYNSYFDKDKESIGGLRHPPPVSKALYFASLTLDLVAILLGLWIGWEFSLMLLGYGLVSKAYSHPAIRLKKFPLVGWYVAGIFQGWYTFMMSYIAINNIALQEVFTDGKTMMAASLSTLLLWGSYPMTQIYQHKEDARRGDRTLSLMLGIKGTFLFTTVIFSLADLLFLYFYVNYYGWLHAVIFQAFLLPMLIYFIIWYMKAHKNPRLADFDHTMRLNWISALCLNACFLFLWWIS